MNKQIEEMARVLNECCNEYDTLGNHIRNKCSYCECWSDDNHCCCSYNTKEATALYNAGYRKASEVAEEIFAEIEASISLFSFHCDDDNNYEWGVHDALVWVDEKIAELKKKITEGVE